MNARFFVMNAKVKNMRAHMTKITTFIVKAQVGILESGTIGTSKQMPRLTGGELHESINV